MKTPLPFSATAIRAATVVLAASVLLAAACGGEPAAPTFSRADLDRVWTGAGATIEVKVHDLYCTKCEASAKEAVGALDGVAAVEADNETDVVSIELTEGADRYALIPLVREALHGIGKQIVGEDPVP